MLLFYDDWTNKHRGAIIHYETSNKSALEFAAKLRQMGIKNHAFFLALFDHRLKNVDPFDPNLTIEQMSWIAIECRNNPWYYFREVVRVPATTGVAVDHVEFNRSNICLWWCFFNHITLFLTQPRQTGKSFCVDLLMTALMNFICNNTQINLMTKNDMLRAENIRRLKNIYAELPKYLQFKTRDDANNTEELSIKKFGNTYKTHVPQGSEKAAYNQGRGMTTPIIQTDEGPFQKFTSKSLGAALGAMGAAIDAARRNGEPYGILHTTTAGKKDDPDGRFYYEMIQNCAIWSEQFYDLKDEEELRKVICLHSRSSHYDAMPTDEQEFKGLYEVYAVFSYKQLGKSDQWMMEQLDRTKLSPEDANRDFFNIWTSGTTGSPLPTETLEQLAKAIVDSDSQTVDPTYDYVLRWYVERDEIDHFMANHDVVCGIDTSDAIGRDYIGLVFTESSTGGVVAATTINRTNLIQFSKWLVKMLAQWPRLVMNIERRSSGVTIIDYLLDMLPPMGIDPFKRLFNWVINDPLAHPALYEEAMLPMVRRSSELYVRAKIHFGFATAGSGRASRSELYSSVLYEAATRCTNRVHDRTLIQQLLGLTVVDGRIDHAEGEHDDLVIGWLLSHFFITKAKNLHHYGFDPKRVLAMAIQAQRQQQIRTPLEQAREHQQNQLRERISTLIERMTTEKEPLVIERQEAELRYLNTQLILKEGENFSLDAVLNEMRDRRSTQMRHLRESHYDRSLYERSKHMEARYAPEGTTIRMH